MAAIGLMKLSPKPARSALMALSLPVLLPPLVVAIAIVVLFVRGLGVGLGLPVVILGHVLVAQPFVILIVMARLARFDTAALDAARDLGATRWQAFRLVMLPQIASALVGAALVSAAISLDDFIIASFTIGGGNTVSTFVWGKMRTTLDPSINAIATVLLVMTVGLSALALRFSRYRT
jgi:spermidine/putrescine transport system permease protein